MLTMMELNTGILNTYVNTIYMKSTQEQISVRGTAMGNKCNFKIGKDEILYTQYSNKNSEITHILCKKINVEPNKMWILWSVEKDGSLQKVAQGGNPLKLEDKIDYIKSVKDQ
jgi:hypothetical protein